jgi:ATPase complex subunit ATP10
MSCMQLPGKFRHNTTATSYCTHGTMISGSRRALPSKTLPYLRLVLQQPARAPYARFASQDAAKVKKPQGPQASTAAQTGAAINQGLKDLKGQLNRDHPVLSSAPRSYGPRVDSFVPTVLSRPIGLPNPPRPGENDGIDHRTLRERRDDFVDYGKHLQRREQIKSQIVRPYFRDWTNLRHHEGKIFLAPPRPFKADYSLYFPNIQGKTLVRGSKEGWHADTTPVLAGKASIVSVLSGAFAEAQCGSFASERMNPELLEVLRLSNGRAQQVLINVEENGLRRGLILLFSGSLRRRLGASNLGRYFIVKQGFSEEIRESIGVLNSKVGYTYLVDSSCRIRWAGSGTSTAEERASLVHSLERLLREMGRAETSGKA